MTRDELRLQIAAEAARLLLRGKEQDFAAARKRAARWLKRQRLQREEIPSNQEIQVQMYALSGLMASERDPMLRAQRRHWVRELMTLLQPAAAVWIDGANETELRAVDDVVLEVVGDGHEVRDRLLAAGYAPQFIREPQRLSPADSGHWTLRLQGQFPCEIRGVSAGHVRAESPAHPRLIDLEQDVPAAAYEPTDDEHPDAFAVFQMLLEPLARVQWPTVAHPEGDALYHSLQVFELGRAEKPYDEEFLLACLLHDVGYGINPRHPVLSAIDALGTLITPRTRFLIEQRPVASHYLLTGDCPKSLRKSPDFEDAVLLARCDRDGRVPGAQVDTLDEALAYIAQLETAWDDE